jgi:hypothetical protein
LAGKEQMIDWFNKKENGEKPIAKPAGADRIPKKVQWPLYARQPLKKLSTEEIQKAREWHQQQAEAHKERNPEKARYHKEQADHADVHLKAGEIKPLKFNPRRLPRHAIWPTFARKKIEHLNKDEREQRRGWHIQMAIASAVQKAHDKAKYHSDEVSAIDNHVKKLADEHLRKMKQKKKTK